MRKPKTRTIDPALLEREASDAYHAQADKYLSSHQLGEFLRCPQLYHRKKLGLIADVDTPGFALGRAAHTLILEGYEELERTYANGGPVNPDTGKPYGKQTKAYVEWAEKTNKPVLTPEQYILIEKMAASVRAHEHAAALLSVGVAEGVVRAEYCGTPCQIRIDWTNPTCGITDLKTCDDLDWFERDAARYRYANQLAFYQSVLSHVLSGWLVPVHIIAVEKREPYRTGVWLVGPRLLKTARVENERAIARMAECHDSDVWPTGYEDVRLME